MTKEEAIRLLNKILYEKGIIAPADEVSECIKMAIKALEQCEVWDGIHGQVVAPKGTFDRIWEDAEKEEQEPCQDCISRAEAIEALNCEISGSIESDIDLSKYKREFQEFANMIVDAQEKAIQALPPAKPQEPKTGHWQQYGDSWKDKFKCSKCGEEQPKILCGERIIGHWSDYCPNCGARMSEVSE